MNELQVKYLEELKKRYYKTICEIKKEVKKSLEKMQVDFEFVEDYLYLKVCIKNNEEIIKIYYEQECSYEDNHIWLEYFYFRVTEIEYIDIGNRGDEA